MTVDDEGAVVARAIDGDPAALEEVVHRVQDPVYRLALRMAGRPADAEDATQEILVRIITRLASWRGEASLTTWSYRIAVNYLLSARRNAYEERTVSFESLGASLADGLADTAYAGPEAELLAEEVRLGCTQAMLQCLDRPLRVTYVLGEVFQLPSEEAAWVLDVTAAAYRKRLERARRRIRWFMSGHCGLVNEAAPCRCARRVETGIALGRVQPDHPVFAAHPVSQVAQGARVASGAQVADGAEQMHRLHDAASVLRSHPAYAAPRDRSEAVLKLLRSGHYPLLSADLPTGLSADRG